METLFYSIGLPGGDISLPHLNESCQSIIQWENKRKDIIHRFKTILGIAPIPIKLSYQEVNHFSMGNITIHRLLMQSYGGEHIQVLLFVPDGTSSKCQPAVLALHPTDIAYSDSLLISRPGTIEDYPYAIELAQQGFVVAAPDVFCRNELPNSTELWESYSTTLFGQLFPEWSAMGRMLYDNILALDLLCSLDFVDANRIGVIGHSLGGTNAIALAAVDQRIRAIAVNCALTPFNCHPNIRIWSRDKGFCYFPSLKKWLDRGIVPFEWHELVEAAAPRPYLVIQTTHDQWFQRWDGTVQAIDCAREVYDLYGKEENIRLIINEGPHYFPRESREIAYKLFHDVL